MSGTVVFILIVVFAISSALDKLRKAGQGTGVPRRGTGTSLPRTGDPYPRTPGDLPTPQPGERPRVLVAGRVPEESESAETLLKEDLWALLTGMGQEAARRAGGLPRQEPAPRSTFELPPRAPEPAPSARAAAVAAVPAAEPDPAKGTPPAATVVMPPPAAPAPAVAPRAAAAAARTRTQLGLGGDVQSLRRAMALQIVLGPPKALE